jgi:hypothetical protein
MSGNACLEQNTDLGGQGNVWRSIIFDLIRWFCIVDSIASGSSITLSTNTALPPSNFVLRDDCSRSKASDFSSTGDIDSSMNQRRNFSARAADETLS